MREALPEERSIARWLFVVTFVGYAYFFGGGGWGTNAHLDLTRAIVEQRSIAVDAYAGNTGDVARAFGRTLINKPPGVSFLGAVAYAPIYLVERAVGVDPGKPLALLVNGYLVNLFVSTVPGAIIPPLAFLYARRQRNLSFTFSLSLALITAFATQLWGWSSLILVHVTSAGFLFASFYALQKRTARGDYLAGALIGVAALTNYMAMPVVAIFAGAILLERHGSGERIKRLVRFCAGGAPFGALFAIYQYSAFGALMKMPISMNERFVTKKSWFGLIDPPSLEALWGITFSAYRGLFYISPVLLFSLLGLVLCFKRRSGSEAVAVIGPVAVFVLINITFNYWDGGFGIGPRYLVPIVPFLSILMMEVSVRRPYWLGLGAVAFANNLATVAVDSQPSGSFSDPLSQYVWPLFLTGRFGEVRGLHSRWSPDLYTGHTSVCRQSLDELLPFQLHQPGSMISEWSSFNLGELITGPGTLLSLVPLAVILAVSGVSLVRRARALDARAGSNAPQAAALS